MPPPPPPFPPADLDSDTTDLKKEIEGLKTSIGLFSNMMQTSIEKSIELKAEIKSWKSMASKHESFLQDTVTCLLKYQQNTSNKMLDWGFKIGTILLMTALGIKSFGVI